MQAEKYAPQDQREALRLRAWQLKQSGWRQKDIAANLGVSNWMRRVRQGGTQALRTRRSTGARPRLNSEQKTSLVHLLEQGPTAHGFVQGNRT